MAFRINRATRRAWAWPRPRQTDRGAGLDPNDRSLLGQKFFRGKRHAQSTSGLGLGFWIASAFVAANQGMVEAVSEGVDNGMAVKIRLPLSMQVAA